MVYFVSRLLVCNADNLLPVQSVDMNMFVNRRQRNQIHSWTIGQMCGIDCRLHQLLGQWVSHTDRMTAECARFIRFLPPLSRLVWANNIEVWTCLAFGALGAITWRCCNGVLRAISLHESAVSLYPLDSCLIVSIYRIALEQTS